MNLSLLYEFIIILNQNSEFIVSYEFIVTLNQNSGFIVTLNQNSEFIVSYEFIVTLNQAEHTNKLFEQQLLLVYMPIS